MLDTFNIKVKKLIKLPQEVVNNYPEEFGEASNIITLVTVEATGEKEGISSIEEKEIHIPFVKTNDFIDYSNLNEETIIGWISEEEIEGIKKRLERTIDDQLSTTDSESDIELPLPWNQQV